MLRQFTDSFQSSKTSIQSCHVAKITLTRSPLAFFPDVHEVVLVHHGRDLGLDGLRHPGGRGQGGADESGLPRTIRPPAEYILRIRAHPLVGKVQLYFLLVIKLDISSLFI